MGSRPHPRRPRWWPRCQQGSCTAGEVISSSCFPLSSCRATGQPQLGQREEGARRQKEEKRGPAERPQHGPVSVLIPTQAAFPALRREGLRGGCEGTAPPPRLPGSRQASCCLLPRPGGPHSLGRGRAAVHTLQTLLEPITPKSQPNTGPTECSRNGSCSWGQAH